jgi:hypothetical protein
MNVFNFFLGALAHVLGVACIAGGIIGMTAAKGTGVGCILLLLGVYLSMLGLWMLFLPGEKKP